VKPPLLGRDRAVLRLCVLYPGICLTTEKKKHGRICPFSRKVPDGHDSLRRHCHLLAGSQVRFVDPGLSTLGDLGQHSVSVDNCRLTKGFPKSDNFESNLSVRDDMVGKNWNPRSSGMYLLLVNQVALAAI